MPTLDVALALLKSTFGYDRLRPGQEDIVAALLAGENVLAVMPTGSGKSMCYQLPALATESLSVVVSPLIALMRDQVAALRLYRVAAGALDSATPPADAAETHRRLRDGPLRLLYISPEQLVQPNVVEDLPRYSPARFAIDEIHCTPDGATTSGRTTVASPNFRDISPTPGSAPSQRAQTPSRGAISSRDWSAVGQTSSWRASTVRTCKSA